MRPQSLKISKREWYQAGDFRNPNCWRRHADRAWRYYINLDADVFNRALIGAAFPEVAERFGPGFAFYPHEAEL